MDTLSFVGLTVGAWESRRFNIYVYISVERMKEYIERKIVTTNF